MKIKTFSKKDKFIQQSALFIARHGAKKSTHEPPFHIALSGGSTPKPIYTELAKISKAAKNSGLPWKDIELWQVDERFVPKTHKESNARLIKNTLIKKLPERPKAFHTFNTNLSIEECLEQYEEELLPQFDLMVLGIGTDGHTASLFPNSPALQEARPVAKTKAPAAKVAVSDRLTLTFPAILQSKKLLVLLQGKNKAGVLKTLQDKKTEVSDFPAKKLLQHPDITIYYCKN